MARNPFDEKRSDLHADIAFLNDRLEGLDDGSPLHVQLSEKVARMEQELASLDRIEADPAAHGLGFNGDL